MNYYSKNKDEFINKTKDCDMSDLYHFFESYLNNNTKTILDLGFGSGRDSLYFINKGYEVYALDPTIEFCDYAKQIGIKNVLCMKAQELNYIEEFDAIWACASLLHVPSDELNEVFIRCSKSLKSNGIMYASFKYGTFEGERNERYFVDLNETSIYQFLTNSNLDVLEIKITEDVRPDNTTKWLNVLLKKN